jgi:hypothetical protein
MDFSMPNKEVTLQPSTIETIDQALYKLIDSGFDLHTRTNSGFKKVPVLWIFPERSFNVKNKQIRDNVGKLKLPLITVERSSFAKDPAFKGGYQANLFADSTGPRGYRKYQRVVKKNISQKTTRKNASTESFKAVEQHHYPNDNKKVVYEEVYMPIPVWVNSTYTLTLRTEYQQQMNDLMTPFATRTGNINSLLIDFDGHQFEAFIESDIAQSNNLSNLGEDERSFETKVTIKVLGYLLGDGANEEAPKIITKETTVEVKIVRERTIVGDKKPWESDNDNYRDI